MIVFSLSTIYNRYKNLEIIIPNILNQCDLLYINLVNYKHIPDILKNDKIIINQFNNVGSEIRFYNYNDIQDDTYYFTIDDDILYPKDYVSIMIKNMQKYDNKSVCCVHGSNIDLKMKSGFYKKNRVLYHFKNRLDKNIDVMIPGVGTSCFYKKYVKINLSDFKVKNMSDPYIGCFLAKQKISKFSIKRNKNWLLTLNDYGKKICGNNPHKEIDKLINSYKKYLKK